MTRSDALRAGRTAAVWSGRLWPFSLPLLAALAGAVSAHRWAAAALALLALSPLALLGLWAVRWPAAYRRHAEAWWVRRRWARYFRRHWAGLCDAAGWALTEPGPQGPVVTVPRLLRTEVTGSGVALVVAARRGQDGHALVAGAGPLGAAMGASSVRAAPVAGHMGHARFSVVLGDALTEPQDALPVAGCLSPAGSAVALGRTEDGAPWVLPVAGRHTLVVGCTGAGKGSILWGVVGGLAPAVAEGSVVLWGVDLKRGVEVETGAALFSARAYTHDDALTVLRSLLAVLDRRGRTMAGVTRQHVASPAEPLHVLVIDELAVLTAYAPKDVRAEAERLLSEVLALGRALGVSVLAFAQDPRKEVIGMRGLFSQTVALRLRSRDEVTMTLGAGMADVAPADRIAATTPGVGYVVTDEGSVQRVRADYWPDALIRATAARCPSPMPVSLAAAAPMPAPSPAHVPAAETVPETEPEQPAAAPRRRQPKQPRQPRQQPTESTP